jgi:hypothetical protein
MGINCQLNVERGGVDRLALLVASAEAQTSTAANHLQGSGAHPCRLMMTVPADDDQQPDTPNTRRFRRSTAPNVS